MLKKLKFFRLKIIKYFTLHILCAIIKLETVAFQPDLTKNFNKERYMREELLAIIEKNSRIPLDELAAMLGTTEDKVVNELSALEKEGVICGYHTLIDWEKTSQEKVNALIEVRVTPQRGQGFDKIAERIYNYPEVRSVYLISGGYDLLVTLEEKSLKEISMFVTDKLSTLDTVLSTATHFILKRYKDHGTILDKKRVDEREIITP